MGRLPYKVAHAVCVPCLFMSLPPFSSQSELFSTAALTGQLFAPSDRYRLFAQRVYPVLARTRSALEKAYCADNGRVAIEPVLLLGVSLLQFLEAVLVGFHGHLLAPWGFAPG